MMRCRNIAYATRPKWMRGMQLGLSCQEEVAVSLPRIWHSLRLLTVYEPITEGGKGRTPLGWGCPSVWRTVIHCLNQHQCDSTLDSCSIPRKMPVCQLVMTRACRDSCSSTH